MVPFWYHFCVELYEFAEIYINFKKLKTPVISGFVGFWRVVGAYEICLAYYDA